MASSVRLTSWTATAPCGYVRRSVWLSVILNSRMVLYSPLRYRRREADDLPEEEEKQRFQMMKNSLLGFVQEFPWGAWARGLIMQWKSFEDVVCAMSNYLSMSWEEKYEILASDSHRERCDKMEAALYEFIEFVRVGNAAESEQKETHESAYRESAIKKQIEYLQRQLDDMHPENITDVRRFEKKSGNPA